MTTSASNSWGSKQKVKDGLVWSRNKCNRVKNLEKQTLKTKRVLS